MNGPDKLKKLRKKTDEELIQLINNELDYGIRAARQVSNFADTWTRSVEEIYSKAKRVHGEASRLMQFCEVSDNEVNELEARLQRLGEILDALASIEDETRLCVI